MNVLVIPSWYPTGYDKLMGIYHKEFCEALSKRTNIQINMLFIDRRLLKEPLKYLFMKKNLITKEKGYTVYTKRMLNVERLSSNWQLKRYTKVLDKAFKKYLENNPKPDVLHAMVTLPAGYATCVLGKKYNIPVVITEHASYYQIFFSGKNKKYGDYALKNSYFTAVSEYMLGNLPKSVKGKVVLHNLVDTEAFKTKRSKVKGLRLIEVCAFRNGKRIEDLLAALKLIIDYGKIKDVKLTLIGDGFLEEFYKTKCHELKLDNYVDFVGRKTKEEIAEYLSASNIYVMPSSVETFGIPGIEALASGIPIVSTKSGGPEEYIDDTCGKLVEVGDVKALADAIMDVYHNLDNYDIKHLRGIASKYSAKSVTDTAIKIYEEITS